MKPEDVGFLQGKLSALTAQNASAGLDEANKCSELTAWLDRLSLTDFIAMAMVTGDGSAGVELLDSILLSDTEDQVSASKNLPAGGLMKRPIYDLLKCSLEVILPTESLISNLLPLWQMCRKESWGWELMYESFERLRDFPQWLNCLNVPTYISLLKILINEEDAGSLIENILQGFIEKHHLSYCRAYTNPPLWERCPEIAEYQDENIIKSLKAELTRIQLLERLANEEKLAEGSVIPLDDLESSWFRVLQLRFSRMDNYNMASVIKTIIEDYELMKECGSVGVIKNDLTDARGQRCSVMVGLSDILVAFIKAYALGAKQFASYLSTDTTPSSEKKGEVPARHADVLTKVCCAFMALRSCRELHQSVKDMVFDNLFFDPELLHVSDQWSAMVNNLAQTSSESSHSRAMDVIRSLQEIRDKLPIIATESIILEKILSQSKRDPEIMKLKLLALQILSKFHFEGRNVIPPSVVDAWDHVRRGAKIYDLIFLGFETFIEDLMARLPMRGSDAKIDMHQYFLHDSKLLPRFWQPAVKEIAGRQFVTDNQSSSEYLTSQLKSYNDVLKMADSVQLVDALEMSVLRKYLVSELKSFSHGKYMRILWLLSLWILFSKEREWKRQVLYIAQLMDWNNPKSPECLLLYIHASGREEDLYSETPPLTTELDLAQLFAEDLRNNLDALLAWVQGYKDQRRQVWACFGLLRYQTQTFEKIIKFSRLIYDLMEGNSRLQDADTKMFKSIFNELLKIVNAEKSVLLPSLARLCATLELDEIRELGVDEIIFDELPSSEDQTPHHKYVSAITEITGNMRKETNGNNLGSGSSGGGGGGSEAYQDRASYEGSAENHSSSSLPSLLQDSSLRQGPFALGLSNLLSSTTRFIETKFRPMAAAPSLEEPMFSIDSSPSIDYANPAATSLPRDDLPAKAPVEPEPVRPQPNPTDALFQDLEQCSPTVKKNLLARTRK